MGLSLFSPQGPLPSFTSTTLESLGGGEEATLYARLQVPTALLGTQLAADTMVWWLCALNALGW